MNSLSDLHKQIATCNDCDCFKEYWRFDPETHGQFKSKIMVVGESSYKPSIDVGQYYAAGSLRAIVDKVLELNDECYVTDLVKCDKTYLQSKEFLDEAASCCFKYLIKEIEVVKPKIIIAVGELSFRYLSNETGSFSGRQGDGKDYFYKNTPVVPIIHPSYGSIHFGKKSWQKMSYRENVRNIFKQALNM